MTSISLVISLFVLSADHPIDTMPSNYWRNPINCGPSCLYAYLKLHKLPIAFEDISSRVPLGENGANLASLRAAANDLGVPSVVLRVDNSHLDSMALPAIAQFHVKDGHYKLILQVNPDRIIAAEMTTGIIENVSRDKFVEQWSGFVLVPQADDTRRSNKMAAGGCLVISSIVCLVHHFRKKSR